ncbi:MULTISPECIES: DUF6414 family protein [Pectobacterium]|uniref:DUF6414 family protein n=1 Tax=Pectobacterium TaxID=122277 RepID=UPI0004E78207|nr:MULTISPECIES: hypothetical protein [Pectobacterium]AVT57988.1 hypothetical protein OA04_13770 [Pectobacterium versatile]KFF72090.1 hypothetical protein IW01_05580 [Pectobacterium brasiliense]
MNNKIRNIIYLDHEKMYSLSSQLFEGIQLESILSESHGQEEINKINGSLLDKLENSNTLTEKMSLQRRTSPHDFDYSRFEESPDIRNKIISVEELLKTPDSKLSNLCGTRIIKSSGKISIIDPIMLNDLLTNLKDHMSRVDNFGLSAKISAIDEMLSHIESSDKKAISEFNIKKKKLLQESKDKLSKIDQKYYNDLAEFIKFGCGDDIEINQNIGKITITSYLQRNFFRQKIDTFIRRYSRQTCCDFTMLGILTQHKCDRNPEPETAKDDFRQSLKNMTHATYGIEQIFNEPTEGEFIVDPICLYTEI